MIIERSCVEAVFVYYVIFNQTVMLCSMTVDFRIGGGMWRFFISRIGGRAG